MRSPTDVIQIGGSRHAFFGERQWRVAIQRGVAARCVVVNLEIGELLFISPGTVHTHVVHVYEKIGVSTRAAAALFAMEHDLLTR